ncbi:hypothetical protein BDW62DRAFT_204736 [Aspergillus aurantiobrunneus]
MGSILPDVSDYDRVVSNGQGLGQVFYQRMLEDPETIAAIDEQDKSLSYRAIHEKATELAQRLSEHEYSPGDRVGVVVEHGLWDPVTQVAIMYAGGTCVPLDPLLPDQQIERRLKRLHTRCIHVDEANRNRALRFTLLVVNSAHNETGKSTHAAKHRFPIPTTIDHCTHLMHTSGTMSEPKAVQSDVVGHLSKTTFDAALFDIWGALLHGATIGVLSKTTLLDSVSLVTALHRLGITIMLITTPLFNLVALTQPTTFEPLRIVLMGGEAINIRAVEAILLAGPPQRLVHNYGPTECCIYCLAHEITLEDVLAGKVSIGKTIGRGVCDDEGNPVNAGEEGELLVGEPGVSSGYVDQPANNAASFVAVPGMIDPQTNQPYRMYRTGDLVRQRSDGQHDFLGRRDEQVKVRGFRVELGAVRSVLMKTGHFAEVFAMAVNSKAEGPSATLVAFAVLHADAVKHAVADAVAAARATLLDFMVPHIEVIAQMPLNTHAKIDRKQLEDLYRQRRERLLMASNGCTAEEAVSTRQHIASIWALILATPIPELTDSDDFFALGGTSLQASLLISRIREQLNTEISLLMLYDHPTLGQLAAIVDQHRESSMPTIRDEQHCLAADIKLADELQLPLKPVVDWRCDTEGRVFLTGATGFVGAFCLASLLVMPGVYQVGCLVRAATPAKGLQRIRAALMKYRLWQDSFASKLLPLCGDLQDYWLGLANVTGTVNVARLAVTGRPKGLHYCSSIACFGPTGLINGTEIIYEDASLFPHLPALLYDHGYSQSQWVADALLQRLINRGFPIAVYRPGFITGDTKTGICNPDDFFSRLIHANLALGCYPDLPEQRKEFVPVDYVVAAMLDISCSVFSLGHAFHLVPSRTASIDMAGAMEPLAQVRGTTIERLSYESWIKRLRASPNASLQPLLPMLAEKVHDGLTCWELHEKMPVFDATNVRRALATRPVPLQCPPFDRVLMTKYID